MSSKKLDTLSNDRLVALTNDVEVRPGWRNAPEGWMQKPDFKRGEQIPSNAGTKVKKGMLANFKKNYQWRWWTIEE